MPLVVILCLTIFLFATRLVQARILNDFIPTVRTECWSNNRFIKELLLYVCLRESFMSSFEKHDYLILYKSPCR